MFKNRILSAGLVLALLAGGSYFITVQPKESQTGPARLFSQKRLLDVSAFGRLTPALPYRILREGDGAWAVEGNRFIVLDPRALRKLFDSLLHLEVGNSLSLAELKAAGSDVGLESPTASFRVEWVGGTSDLIEIGAKNPVTGRRYLRVNRGERAFLSDDLPLSTLAKPLESLRLAVPFAMAPEEVTRVKVYGPSNFVMERKGDNWEIDGRAADADFVLQKLRDLALLQADEFLDPPSVEADRILQSQPIVTFDFSYRETDKQVRFRIWEKEAGLKAGDLVPAKSVYVEREGWPSVFRVTRRAHLEFLRGPSAFKERTPFRSVGMGKLLQFCIKRGSEEFGVRLNAESGVAEELTSQPNRASYVASSSCAGKLGQPLNDPAALARRIAIVPVITHIESDSPEALRAVSDQSASEFDLSWKELSASGDVEYRLTVLKRVQGEHLGDPPSYVRFKTPREEFLAVVSTAELNSLWKDVTALGSE